MAFQPKIATPLVTLNPISLLSVQLEVLFGLILIRPGLERLLVRLSGSETCLDLLEIFGGAIYEGEATEGGFALEVWIWNRDVLIGGWSLSFGSQCDLQARGKGSVVFPFGILGRCRERFWEEAEVLMVIGAVKEESCL